MMKRQQQHLLRQQVWRKLQSISLKDIMWIIGGSFILSFGVNYFTVPNDFSEGGLLGVTIILYYLFGWDLGVTSIIGNGLLFIVGYKLLDRRTMVYSVVAVVSTSFFLSLTHNWGSPTEDKLLAAVYAGILIGVGIGMVLRVGGTTGGGVIIARLMERYLHLSVAVSMFIIDAIVVGTSGFFLGEQVVLYTLIAIIIGSWVIDLVAEGLNIRKAVTIISDKQEELAVVLTETLGRSATIIHGHGYYTKQDKNMLYMIVDKRQIGPLKKIVQVTDDRAFVVIHQVKEVIGEGFSYPSR